jgi:hypothetical protein
MLITGTVKWFNDAKGFGFIPFAHLAPPHGIDFQLRRRSASSSDSPPCSRGHAAYIEKGSCPP